MSGKYVWVEDGQRKAKGRRRSTKGIKTTRLGPKWKRDVQAAWKRFIRSAKLFLMAAGFVTLLIVIANWMGGG